MNKKIGILNYQFSNHNYGAVLQAASLHRILSNLGFDVEHIDYVPEKRGRTVLQVLREKIGDVLRLLSIKKKVIKHDDFINPEVFELFRSEWLPRTNNRFNNIDELSQYEFEYDYVIVGSDQVWRPSYTENSALIYFLSFLPEHINRVSYAASFGIDSWELSAGDPLTGDIYNELSKFKSISVRENTGVDICETIFDQKAEQVLDPTLLVGKQFFSDIQRNDFDLKDIGKVVYYKLDLDQEFLNFVSTISQRFCSENENIYYQEKAGKSYYRTVSEWVGMIEHSKVVITDSFHCICLAIIFEKEFIYYPNNNNRGMTRIESLLAQLGLLDRICYENKKFLDGNILLEPIDYAFVNKQLRVKLDSSFDFIYNSLNCR